MNLITPGSLSWVAYLEMGARLENSPPPKKSPVRTDGAFHFWELYGTIYLLAVKKYK